MGSAAKVTSKGQVTIPKDVRDRHGIKPGDQLEFIEDRGGLRVKKRLAKSPFAEWRGYLKDLKGKDPDALIEEMRGR